MKFPFINDPKTGQPDEMVSLTVLVTFAAVGRFIVDGMTLSLFGHSLTFSHVDSLTYLAFLTPIVGAHGYLKGKNILDGKDV